jgi:hypothetical protein
MGLFGKEKITLALEKYDYVPGDKIKGRVTLSLKKPTNARKLEVSFIGRKITHQSNVGSRNRSGSSTQYQTVYSFSMPLDGEKEYHTGDYPFEIKIPDNIFQSNPNLDGKLGSAVRALQMLGGTSSRIDWIVKAQLDVPMGLDVKKSQKIVLSTQ